MSSLLTTVALFTVVLSAFVGYLYLFGLPSTTKRKINDAALNSMGEHNKPTHMVKDVLNSIPDSDNANKGVHHKDVRDGGVSDATLAALQKPLGEAVGEKTDEVHRPVAGR